MAAIGFLALPFQGIGQNLDSIPLQGIQLLPKPKLKYKGWYFGVNVGPATSKLYYQVPKDPKTGYTGTNNAGFFSSNYFIAPMHRNLMFQTNARYVVGKRFAIDFTNVFKQDRGTITMYKEWSTGGWFSFTSYFEPKEQYSLNLLTNQFTVTPNLVFGSPRFNSFMGIGVGFSTLLHRGGNFNRDFELNKFAFVYKANIGLTCRIAQGNATFTISGNGTSNMARKNWGLDIGYNAYMLSYSLPVSAFKKKKAAPVAG